MDLGSGSLRRRWLTQNGVGMASGSLFAYLSDRHCDNCAHDFWSVRDDGAISPLIGIGANGALLFGCLLSFVLLRVAVMTANPFASSQNLSCTIINRYTCIF